MRKIPIILTLILTAIWGYTSWYWYVCSMKSLCNIPKIEASQTQREDILSYQDVVPEKIEESETWDEWTWEILTGSLSSSPKLSASDVLYNNPKPKQVEATPEPSTWEDSATWRVDITTEVLSWSTVEDQVWDENLEKDTELSLCQKPLVWPIGLWTLNDEWEVARLEAFLLKRGDISRTDWVYGQDDFEAIKRFQIEFRADILDPWDIINPTGYVYKTTVKKINEVACQ